MTPLQTSTGVLPGTDRDGRRSGVLPGAHWEGRPAACFTRRPGPASFRAPERPDATWKGQSCSPFFHVALGGRRPGSVGPPSPLPPLAADRNVATSPFPAPGRTPVPVGD